jgi:hypothetical protein
MDQVGLVRPAWLAIFQEKSHSGGARSTAWAGRKNTILCEPLASSRNTGCSRQIKNKLFASVREADSGRCAGTSPPPDAWWIMMLRWEVIMGWRIPTGVRATKECESVRTPQATVRRPAGQLSFIRCSKRRLPTLLRSLGPKTVPRTSQRLPCRCERRTVWSRCCAALPLEKALRFGYSRVPFRSGTREPSP